MAVAKKKVVLTVECDKHEIIGCVICSGQYTTRAGPPKPPAKPKVKAPKAPDLILAEKVASGIICADCLTETKVGCACSRRALYDEEVPDSEEWLKANEEEFIVGNRDAARAITGARRAITGMAFSTQTRAARRAGLLVDDLLKIDEVGEERRRILRDFEVDPTWHAARRQEADFAPI